MDDLISRKAAIEAVQNRHMMLSKEKVLLINDIEKLPSAQLATDTNVGWDGEQWNDGDGQQCPFEVIAWMPLPPSFKEE